MASGDLHFQTLGEGFKFGFELEFVSKLNLRDLQRDLINELCIPILSAESLTQDDVKACYMSRMYLLGHDISIRSNWPQFKSGLELRSFVFSIEELDLHRPLFNAFKRLGMGVNETCGLHIHVSIANHTLDGELVRKISDKEQVRVDDRRKKYTDWSLLTTEHSSCIHQRRDNHLEFRWFNAAINFRYLCKMVRLVEVYARQASTPLTKESTCAST